MMGGADGEALEELISILMTEPGSEAHPPDSKSYFKYEYSLVRCIIIGYEDFDGHFDGQEDFDDPTTGLDDAEDFILPLFEPEDDLYDPLAVQEPSQPPETSEALQTPPSPASVLSSLLVSSSSQASSQHHAVLPSDTISVACRLQDLVPVKEKKRPCKPSPSRSRRPSCDEWLDRFLERGCGCASNCFQQFDREYYCLKRDEANDLSRELLDMVVLGQIQAFTCMENVVGPSHKHAPHQRQRTRVQTLMHAGKRVCKETFLALHTLGIHVYTKQIDLCTFLLFSFREVTIPSPQGPLLRVWPGVSAAWKLEKNTIKHPHPCREGKHGEVPEDVLEGQLHSPAWAYPRI